MFGAKKLGTTSYAKTLVGAIYRIEIQQHIGFAVQLDIKRWCIHWSRGELLQSDARLEFERQRRCHDIDDHHTVFNCHCLTLSVLRSVCVNLDTNWLSFRCGKRRRQSRNFVVWTGDDVQVLDISETDNIKSQLNDWNESWRQILCLGHGCACGSDELQIKW